MPISLVWECRRDSNTRTGTVYSLGTRNFVIPLIVDAVGDGPNKHTVNGLFESRGTTAISLISAIILDRPRVVEASRVRPVETALENPRFVHRRSDVTQQHGKEDKPVSGPE